ncbi:unnamed protein product [Closterium sp. Yama58-4]|nr:unnamed protein product [Closterium sp. Yama58-4]
MWKSQCFMIRSFSAVQCAQQSSLARAVSSPVSVERRLLRDEGFAADRRSRSVAQEESTFEPPRTLREHGDSKPAAALFPRIPGSLAKAEPKPAVAASQQESRATEGDDPIERANIVGRAELYVADGMGSVKEASSSLLASSVLTENNQGGLLTEVKVGLDGLVVESPCDTNEGLWEEDSDWPLYKAGDCPLIWHTGNQCMENGRPDTLYQRLRYKQPRCPAPKLNGNTLCSLVANRSIAFVGDSLTENMFESLICLLHRFHGSPTPVSVGQQERVLRWPACNTTIAFYWSAYLTKLSLTVPGEHSKGGQLDLSHVDMHWGHHVAEHDTFVINTAHWWSPQRLWLGGIPFSPPYSSFASPTSLLSAYRTALNTALSAFSSPESSNKLVVVTTSVPGHKEAPSSNQCSYTEPLKPFLDGNQAAKRPGSHMDGFNAVVRGAVEEYRKARGRAGWVGADAMVLDIHAVSVWRQDGHPGVYTGSSTVDCGHYCLPVTEASSTPFSLTSFLESFTAFHSSESTQDRTETLSDSHHHVARRRLAGITELVDKIERVEQAVFEPQVIQRPPRPSAVGRVELYVDDGMAVDGADTSDDVMLSRASPDDAAGPALLPLDDNLVTDVSPVAKQQVLERSSQRGAGGGAGNPEDRTSCSMERGSWQVDPTWPLYDATCPFIYGNQNCVKNGRPDRLFERIRWTTPGCPLPTLNKATLCSLVAGKSIAFIGDSVTRNTFESLACLMYGFYGMPEDLAGINMSYGLERGFLWPSCNFTLAFYRTNFMVQLTLDDPGKPKGGGVMDLGKPDERWMKRLDQHDIFVINTGHWWTEQKIHGSGFRFAPPHQKLSVAEGFQKAWEMTLGVFKSDRMRGKVLVIPTNSATHFTGQGFKSECPHKAPMNATGFLNDRFIRNYMTMEPYNGVMRKLVAGMHGKERAEGRMQGAKVVLLDQARPTLFRSDGHPGKWALLPNGVRDCGHFCLPGVPDAWNEMMLQRLWVLDEAQRE